MGEDEKGGNMKTCKCEHWAVCPICQPEWFDIDGNRLPPEPTPLQKLNGRIEELEQQLAEAQKKLEFAEACLAGDGALITGLKADLAERDKRVVLYEKALIASWPQGAIGEAFDFWNAARILATTEPKQGLDDPVPNLKPADDCGIRYVK